MPWLWKEVSSLMINKRVDITTNKKTECWVKWMEWGQRLGCHQKPERSFFLKGYQMPVCARCTGVFFGYLAAFILLPFLNKKEKQKRMIVLLGSSIMLMDWSVQALHIKESTNKRRVVTGFFGGIGIMTGWMMGLSHLLTIISYARNG
ncbi:MAG: hypothetical protein PWP24_1289 [Clostridiales bacterium]|nr:hypothetical protein [Clostridiales bacterium]